MSGWRLPWRAGLLAPAAIALGLLLCASLWPLDVARRSFQELARADGLPLEANRPYLLVSTAGSARAEVFSVRVLSRLGWPDPRAAWLVVGDPATSPATALTLDARGQLWNHTVALSADSLQPFVRDGVVLYDDAATQRATAQAWPSLADAPRAHVLAAYVPAGLVRRTPRSAWTYTRHLRLTALLAVPLLLWTWLRAREPVLPATAAFGASLLVALAALLWLASLSQVTPLPSPGVWPYVAWLGAAVLAASAGREAPAASISPRRLGAGGWALVVLVTLYVLGHLLRLDLDEDAHAHWALMARAYYSLGHHEPAAVQGHVHAATYPYGYATLLSLSGWAATVPQAGFFRICDEMGTALLFYRFAVAGLDLALLGLLAAWLRSAFPREVLWPAGLALFWAVVPVLRGEHIAAETFLVPLLGGGLVLVRLGRQLFSLTLISAGLFVAVAGTLLKLEGGLLFALAVAPWLVADMAATGAWRRRGPWLALLVGLWPVVQWRLSLPASSPLYDPPSLAGLLASGPQVAQSYSLCARFVLRQGLLLPLLALPLACATYRLKAGLRGHDGWRGLLVPASVLTALLALPLIYVFSHLPREHQIETSFGRLLFLPTLSAWLYAFDTLARASPPSPPTGGRG